MSPSSHQLQVFNNKNRLGELTYDSTSGTFTWSYAKSWLESPDRFAISPHLPLDQTASPPEVVERFLENLMPEGEGLNTLAQTLRVAKSNTFALLASIGSETAGGLSFIMNNQTLPTRFRAIGREELKSRIRERQQKPISIWDGRPRLSLAGVQEKLPIVIRDGEFGLGEGDIASTHILKFSNAQDSHMALNEYFCMQLARASGLIVADCELIDLSERVLLVKRFDRAWSDANTVLRTHVIDGCQALDVSPAHKYERFLGEEAHVQDIWGPANLQNLYGFAKHCEVPAKTQLEILHWTFFNLLIGNCDNHMKNISFSMGSTIRLAPFYDLVNVTMYPQVNHALAFQIGGCFDLEQLAITHFAKMAEDLRLKPSFVMNQLKKSAKSVSAGLAQIQVPNLNQEEATFLANLKNQIQRRAQYFLFAEK